jgi:hypothetical protein
VRVGRRGRWEIPWDPYPRLLEGILVPLVWVHLYVCLDNARYKEGITCSLQK